MSSDQVSAHNEKLVDVNETLLAQVAALTEVIACFSV